MKTFKRFFTLFLFALLNSTFAQQPITKRVALVMGAQNYVSVPRLQHSLNDARDMSLTLRTKGFEVIELYDPKTKKDVQNAVRKYFDLLQGQDGAAGIFYYSGHGMQVKGSNYIVPVTADPKIEADLDDQCVKMDYILTALEQASNSLNIVILDACRNNPFRGFSRAADKGLNMVDAPKGSYIVYATKPGSVASDGAGRNGLFTSKLLKYINTPNLNIEQVFKKVAFDVSKESGDQQRPWIASDYTGNFYFSKDANAPVSAAEEETASVVAFDSAALKRHLRLTEIEEEANFTYAKAEKDFDKNDYQSSLEYLAKTENNLGPDVPKIVFLRIKIYNQLQKQSRENFLALKKNIDSFFKLPTTDDIRKDKFFEVMEIKNVVTKFEAADEKFYSVFKDSKSSSEIKKYLDENKNTAYYLDMYNMQIEKEKIEALSLVRAKELSGKISLTDAKIRELQTKKTKSKKTKTIGALISLVGVSTSFLLPNSVNGGTADEKNSVRLQIIGASSAIGLLIYVTAPSKKKINKQIEKLNQEKKQFQTELDGLIAAK
jgi:uncharacterized caspase-like protein